MDARTFLLASLLTAFAVDAAACSCLTSNPKSAFKFAEAVFVGDVVEYDGRMATMRVVEAFKGSG